MLEISSNIRRGNSKLRRCCSDHLQILKISLWSLEDVQNVFEPSNRDSEHSKTPRSIFEFSKARFKLSSMVRNSLETSKRGVGNSKLFQIIFDVFRIPASNCRRCFETPSKSASKIRRLTETSSATRGAMQRSHARQPLHRKRLRTSTAHAW